MENRFGFKDLVTALLFVLLIVVVFVGMKQLDRQWDVLQGLQNQGKDQTRLLASISRTLEEMSANGVSVGGGSQATTRWAQPMTKRPDPFAPLKEVEARPDFARGDFLVDNFETKVAGTLTPYISTDLYADWVHARVIEWLSVQDPDSQEYLPLLARDWQVSDDGLKITFQIRRGVRFSDGEPMTADDVVYSYQFVMNPKINAPRLRAYMSRVKSVEKTNDYEVVFTMTEPYFGSFDICSSLFILPKHFYSKFEPEQVNQNPGLLMGTGPYKMRDPQGWRPGQKIELLRNELYWGDQPTFDRIIYGEVQEEAAQETMFRNGELDVYRCRPPQYERLLKDPTVMAKANAFAVDSPMNGYYFMAWNQRREGKPTIFADARVRRAMTMMTDREAICKQVLLGYATPISGPFGATSPQADPSIKPLPYDPAAAKKLLAEAGFTDRDGSGTLKNAAGVPLRFKLMYGVGNATVERSVLMLKDNFAKAGVIMEPDPQQWAVVIQRVEHRDFEALTMGWGGNLESDLYQEFDSSQIADAGDNFMSYSNPEFDRVVAEARRTMDRDKRMKLWHECHRILAEDQPYTFLYDRKTLRFVDKRVQNVKPSKTELNVVDLWPNPIPWYVPKKMQRYAQQ